MLVPDYVENYWRAQLWIFLYFGIPMIIIATIVGFVSLWQNHQKDMHANDEEPRIKAGKTLGL